MPPPRRWVSRSLSSGGPGVPIALARWGCPASGRTRWLNPSYALHVSFYNLCRVHETLRSTPAMALGIADRVWTIGDLLDAALAAMPPLPTPTIVGASSG